MKRNRVETDCVKYGFECVIHKSFGDIIISAVVDRNRISKCYSFKSSVNATTQTSPNELNRQFVMSECLLLLFLAVFFFKFHFILFSFILKILKSRLKKLAKNQTSNKNKINPFGCRIQVMVNGFIYVIKMKCAKMNLVLKRMGEVIISLGG